MYPYHNRIKQRIKNGEMTGYEFVSDYKSIGECMLLYFSTPPFERPVRPYKYYEYTDIITEWQKQKVCAKNESQKKKRMSEWQNHSRI